MPQWFGNDGDRYEPAANLHKNYSSMELVSVSAKTKENRRLRSLVPGLMCAVIVFLVLRQSTTPPKIDAMQSLEFSKLIMDPNNYTLVEQAIQEQTTLPKAQASIHIPADLEKHMEAIAQIQDGPDDKVDVNLTMPDSIKKLLDQFERMKHGNITDHVLSLVNITNQVKPIPLEIVAGAKQAENEMVADDVVNNSP